MTERFRFDVDGERLTAFAYRPVKPIGATLLLGHGASAGQRGQFVTRYASGLAERGVLVVTYDFPFMAHAQRRPDSDEVLQAVCRAAIVAARQCRPKNQLFIGGKSLGGRVAAEVVVSGGAEADDVDGLVLLGYPLHPIGRPAPSRARALAALRKPVLFVQGTRDVFGTAAELGSIAAQLPSGTEVHAVLGGDHSLIVARDARNEGDVDAEIQDDIARFMASLAEKAAARPLPIARRASSRVRAQLRALRRSAV
jgi:predicted alpha/beta-hydrolase family hydrolase